MKFDLRAALDLAVLAAALKPITVKHINAMFCFWTFDIYKSKLICNFGLVIELKTALTSTCGTLSLLCFSQEARGP